MAQNLAKLINKTGGGISSIYHCEILRLRRICIVIHLIFIILAFATLSHLNAIELSSISSCGNNQDCKISTQYDEVVNSSNHTTGGSEGIQALERIGSFINYGEIKVGGGQQTFTIQQQGYIGHFINYGTFANLDKMGIWVNNDKGMGKVTNYGVMGSINYGANSHKITTPLTLNNLGLIGAKGAHIAVMNGSKVLIENYMVRISETATAFNNFNGSNSNPNNFSHLVINIASNNGSITFKDGAKMILDFGGGFEFGEKYLISKLTTDESGNATLSVDFDRLTPKSDIYTLYKQGDYFIARLQPQHGIISNIYKANVRTMNNFYLMSNAMIFPRKFYKSQNLGKKNPSLRDSALDSANHLKSYESFAYRNEAVNRRIQRQNKRNYSRTKRNNNSVILSESEESQKKNNRDSSPKAQNDNVRFSQNLAQNPHDYYFILTPFINHNHFFESGRYNLRGFDYGFLTAFSAKVAESNSLGAHFIFSYGSLGDKQDKDLSIKNLNLNLGLNYKLDLVWDMFVKARGDFYYFLNQTKTLTLFEATKPNNLGFGVSVAYGKDFDFKSGGVLGIEAGLDYKALKTNEVLLNSQTYTQSLLNLIYADVGMNYNKYFGGFGINLGTGFKANLAPKLAESALIINSQTLKFTLDNDKYLGYANAGISYVLNAKDFDMEFGLAYYGNYGDRIISNAGGFEWRVGW